MNDSRKIQSPGKPAATHPSDLPSSPGDSPREMVPKDISPQDASWADRTERKISSSNQQEHEEALLDEAVEESFPASDPIAIPSSEELKHEKQLRQSGTSRMVTPSR